MVKKRLVVPVVRTRNSERQTMNVTPKVNLTHLYKSDKKVTVRRPRSKNNNCVQFDLDSTDRSVIARAKQFLKYVAVDVKELNFIRNQIGFLLTDIYGDDHSDNLDTDVYDGRMFYVWTFLPWENAQAGESRLPHSIRHDIFPFDVTFVKRPLSNLDCKTIVNILKRDLDVSVHVRRIHQSPQLPLPLCAA